jgi:hypothetical protein
MPAMERDYAPFRHGRQDAALGHGKAPPGPASDVPAPASDVPAPVDLGRGREYEFFTPA